jgi:hypothetical protein
MHARSYIQTCYAYRLPIKFIPNIFPYVNKYKHVIDAKLGGYIYIYIYVYKLTS